MENSNDRPGDDLIDDDSRRMVCVASASRVAAKDSIALGGGPTGSKRYPRRKSGGGRSHEPLEDVDIDELHRPDHLSASRPAFTIRAARHVARQLSLRAGVMP
jgi:hypothetical protein